MVQVLNAYWIRLDIQSVDQWLWLCREALQTGLSEKRKAEAAPSGRGPKRKAMGVHDVLGDLSASASSDESDHA